jgi:flavodoxin
MKNGGIQKGTTAYDEESRRLDQLIKDTAKKLKLELKSFQVITRMTKQMKIDLVGDDCFGFAPDGGAWFITGKLVAVFEGKKQGENGNAYERWWDNAVTAKHINPDVKYITFCTGGGAVKDKCLDKLRRKAKIMMGKNFEMHLKVDPFTTEEIEAIMRSVLEKYIQ